MGPAIFSLTPVLGADADADRTMSVATVEVNRRFFIAALISFLPAIVVATPLVAIMGTWGLVIALVVLGVVFYALTAKARDGLREKKYRRWLAIQRSSDKQVVVRGQVIDPDYRPIVIVSYATKMDPLPEIDRIRWVDIS